MRLRHYATAAMTCAAVGVGLWYFMQGKDPQDDNIVQPVPKSQDTTGHSGSEIPDPPAPVVADLKTSEAPSGQPAPVAIEAPKAPPLPRLIAEFANRADPDPVLSKEAEFVVQAAIHKELDS